MDAKFSHEYFAQIHLIFDPTTVFTLFLMMKDMSHIVPGKCTLKRLSRHESLRCECLSFWVRFII